MQTGTMKLLAFPIGMPPNGGAAAAAEKPRRPTHSRGETAMRFMVLVKANKDSEAGVLPSEKVLAEMGKFIDELAGAACPGGAKLV